MGSRIFQQSPGGAPSRFCFWLFKAEPKKAKAFLKAGAGTVPAFSF
jgi:hypothetical protein